MKICIVGGGHMGTTLSCFIKHKYPEYHVSLLTSQPEKFKEEIFCNDIEKRESYAVALDVITSDPSATIPGA